MTMDAKSGTRACVLALALALTLALALLSAASSATAAEDRSITLRLGAESALALERPFKTVLIGDPNIVNVRTRTDRSVVLEPLNPGATNLVFIDEASIAITNIRVLVHGVGAMPISYRRDSAGE